MTKKVTIDERTGLTETSTKMLIAVGMGCVTHYPAHSTEGDDTFYVLYGTLGRRNSTCPKIEGQTQAGRSLLRKGLIEPLATKQVTDARLTERGLALFEMVVSDEQRAAMAEQAEYDAHVKADAALRERKRMWEIANEAVLKDHREASYARSIERNKVDAEFIRLAEQVGDGLVNDIDVALEQMRTLRRRRRELAREQDEANAALPQFPG